MESNKNQILELFKYLLWDTPVKPEQAYEEFNRNTEFGNQMKARLLGYVSWYRLLSVFDINTIFQWVDDDKVKPKVWPKSVFDKYESIRRILSK